MRIKKLLTMVALTLAFSTTSVMASSMDDEEREALLQNVKKKVKIWNKVMKREPDPGVRADLLVDLKEELTNMDGPICTTGLSTRALELYKQKERILSEGLDPRTTPLECFQNMVGQAHQVCYLQGHIRLLRITLLADLYRKMGDVNRMDDLIGHADHFYMLAAHILVDALYDYDDHEYLSATLRWVSDLLTHTSIYKGLKKPIIQWAMDTYKAKKGPIADRIFDMVYTCEVEPVSANNLLSAGYYSHLLGNSEYAQIYQINALVKFGHMDPMFDQNVGSRAERLSNFIMSDVLSALFADGTLKPVNRPLVMKWSVFLDDGKLVKGLGVKRIDTALGTLHAEDLNSGENLYKRVKALHSAQLKHFE